MDLSGSNLDEQYVDARLEKDTTHHLRKLAAVGVFALVAILLSLFLVADLVAGGSPSPVYRGLLLLGIVVTGGAAVYVHAR